jgi:propionate CoA-transferase
MSYVERNNPSLTGEIRSSVDELEPMELDARKLIARRAFFRLQPNKIVNLGIGLPEGVASVAAEEGMLDYITLSTEPGVFGGLPASGHSFGPAFNASSLMEMNQVSLHFHTSHFQCTVNSHCLPCCSFIQTKRCLTTMMVEV